MTPPTVLVVGHYGAGNIGDEAVLAGTLALLREAAPGCVPHVMTQDVEATRQTHDVAAVHGTDLRGLLACLAAADLVVMGGGGLLFDYGGLEPSLLVSSEEAWASYYLVPGLAAASGTPVVMLGQGVGPITGSGGRDTIGSLARSLTALTVRDTASRDLLLSLGVDGSRVEVTSDLAFAAPQLRPTVRTPLLGSEAYAALSVRRPVLPTGPSVVPAALEAVDVLHAGYGMRSRFIDFQDGLVDDAELSQELVERLPPGSASRVQDVDGPSLKAATEAVWGAALVVGMRLHSVVFALAAGIPVVALSYDPKVRALMAEAGLPHRCVDVAELGPGTLTVLLHEVLRDLPGEAAASSAAGERMRIKGLRNTQVLKDVIAGRCPPATDSRAFLAQTRLDVGVLRSGRTLTRGNEDQRMELDALRRELDDRRLAARRELDEQRQRTQESERRRVAQEQELQRAQEQLRHVGDQLGRSTSLLRREEISVLKPLARRACRAAQAAVQQLSQTVRGVRADRDGMGPQVMGGRAGPGPTMPVGHPGCPRREV